MKLKKYLFSTWKFQNWKKTFQNNYRRNQIEAENKPSLFPSTLGCWFAPAEIANFTSRCAMRKIRRNKDLLTAKPQTWNTGYRDFESSNVINTTVVRLRRFYLEICNKRANTSALLARPGFYRSTLKRIFHNRTLKRNHLRSVVY